MRDIVVIGGSTGSGAVLRDLVSQFGDDLPAAVFITTHVPAHLPSHMVSLLSARSRLPVSWAADGAAIRPGHIYVAPPDRHLLLIDGGMRLGEGARENMSRPAVDPMFRSAAFNFRERVVGVILTGLLNDGAAGLAAISQCGGAAVVQDPGDAEADEMPRAALEAAPTAYTAAVPQLGALIDQLVRAAAPAPAADCPEAVELEVMIALGAGIGSLGLSKLAAPSVISCPGCHGVLSEMKTDGPLRYRCQIGHAYTAECVLAAKEGEVDEALGVALRVLEERLNIVARMAKDAREHGRTAVAQLYQTRADEYERYASTLREAATLSLRASRGLPPLP